MTIVTKANIVKLADGNFIEAVRRVGEEYPEMEIQERLVDAMCAKMLDPEFNRGIEVIVLPNLYGDIVTDVAAKNQGGLGTASSSNVGNHYAMFEAIHGTAPFLINHGRGNYNNPCSLIRAAGMPWLILDIGDRKELLDRALDICTITERKCVITTRIQTGQRQRNLPDYLLETIEGLKREGKRNRTGKEGCGKRRAGNISSEQKHPARKEKREAMRKFHTVFMRGGTSKGCMFHKEDLPENRDEWDSIFLQAMGDPNPKQIDGLGGTVSSNNKIVIVWKSQEPGIDVEYLVGQVIVGKSQVDYKSNCGNMTAAVGPYAVEEGMVDVWSR